MKEAIAAILGNAIHDKIARGYMKTKQSGDTLQITAQSPKIPGLNRRQRRAMAALARSNKTPGRKRS